ncbi:MAG TPA: AraC family transcriptional regulator [Bryobacteraceae bacterium]|jgi:AraC-like DNA-binding protein|nr:AraC family transcriptional regulator [Bryobacteraceae bacterium]
MAIVDGQEPNLMETASKLDRPSPTRFWFYQDFGICLHYFGYAAGGLDYLPHTHDEYNVVLCLKGMLDYVVEGARQSLGPGDVMVINPGDVHYGSYGRAPGESVGLSLHLNVRGMQHIVRDMRLPIDMDTSSVSFLGRTGGPRFLALGQELLHEFNQSLNGYEMLTQALVVELMVHLLRHGVHPMVHTPRKNLPRQLPSWQMVRAVEYMNACAKSSFSLGELCSSVGTSTTRFIQLFKNSMVDQLSPHACFNHLVINKAKRLLQVKTIPVKEISYELGFRNESHFGKVFRSCTGTTPGNFRLSAPEVSILADLEHDRF